MAADSVLYDLDTLYLEIDPRQQDHAWQQSQRLPSPDSRWRAYCNQLALDALSRWLAAEGIPPQRPLARWATLWELVSGSALCCQGARLILVPTEALDDDELRVPQEWVDIPSWAGDYYLALQINPDEGSIRFGGWATHQLLKQNGDYDWRDRTYSLTALNHSFSDRFSNSFSNSFAALQVTQAQCPEAPKRVSVPALPALATAQAQALIGRLASSTEPRLALAFEQWGALLAHDGWRRELAERRWGRSPRRLGQWLRSGMANLAEQLAEQLADPINDLIWQPMTYQPALATARDSESASGQQALYRDLVIQGEPHTLKVMLLDAQDRQAPSQNQAWRVELSKAAGPLSAGVTLRLLTEDLQPFEHNQVIATDAVDRIYVDVAIEGQEGLVWEIEPTPEQYEREILRF